MESQKIDDLRKRVTEIEERNRRVEADKSWEVSYFRVITLSLLIYLAASFVLYSLADSNFYLNALVPGIGYFLSMRSLPFVKRWWIRKHSL